MFVVSGCFVPFSIPTFYMSPEIHWNYILLYNRTDTQLDKQHATANKK